MNQDKPLVAWLFLILLALIWGSSFFLIKKGLEVYSASEVAALRISAAGLFLLPYGLFKLRSLPREKFKILILVGIVGSFLPAFLFSFAQTRITSSLAGIMNGLTPFFVVIIGVLLFKQTFNRNTAYGLLLGFIGLILLIITGEEGIGDINIFALFVVGATLCYGLNLNIVKYKLLEVKPRTITSVSLMAMLPISLAYLLGGTEFLDHLQSEEDGLLAAFYIVMLGVFGTSIALNIFNRLIKISSPVFASYVTYLIPIVAIFWGLYDGEPIYALQILGMLIIIAGIFLTRNSKPITKK